MKKTLIGLGLFSLLILLVVLISMRREAQSVRAMEEELAFVEGADEEALPREEGNDEQPEAATELPNTESVAPAATPMPTPGRLVGVVVNDSDEPIAGVRVSTLVRPGMKRIGGVMRPVFPAAPAGPVMTDEQGRFELAPLETREAIRLAAVHPEYAPTGAGPFDLNDSTTRTIVMEPGATLTGLTFDEISGAPVAGLDVYALTHTHIDMNWFPTAKTDGEGNFEIGGLGVGEHVVGGMKKGNALVWVARPEMELKISRVRENYVSLAVADAATIEGHVFDQDGAGISDATVTATIGEAWRAEFLGWDLIGLRGTGTTKIDGTYSIAGMVPGAMRGRAGAEGYVDEYRAPGLRERAEFGEFMSSERDPAFSAGAGEKLGGIDYVLLDEKLDPYLLPISVRGKVVDTNGAPAQGITVKSYSVSGGTSRSISHGVGASAVTDEAGKFELREEKGKVKGLVVFPEATRPTFAIHDEIPEPETEVVLELVQCASVEGVVTDTAGVPLADVEVTARRRGDDASLASFSSGGENSMAGPISTRTDITGGYRLDLVQPGSYEIEARKDGYEAPQRRRNEEFALESGQDGIYQTIVMNVRPEFRGQLVQWNGSPAAGWRVSGNPTDDEGWFEYRLREGENRLSFQKGNSGRMMGIGGGAQSDLEYRTGQIMFSEIRPEENHIYVIPEPGWIAGRVVFEGVDEPVPGIEARIERVREGDAVGGAGDPFALTLSGYRKNEEEFTNKNGYFEVKDVPADSFRLTLLGAGAVRTTVDFRVESGKLVDLGTIEVRSSRKIRGVFVNAKDGTYVASPDFRGVVRQQEEEWGRSEMELSGPDPFGKFEITGAPIETELLWVTAVAASRSSDERLYGELQIAESEPGADIDLGEVYLTSSVLRFMPVDKKTGVKLAPEKVSPARVTYQDFGFGEQTRIYNAEQGSAVEYVEINPVPFVIERVTVDARNYSPVVVEGPFSVNDEGIIELGDVLFDPGETLTGRVIGEDGQPVSRCSVVVRWGENMRRTTSSGEDGTFSVVGIPPGKVTVQPTMPTRDSQQGEWGVLASEPVEMEIGERGNNKIELRIGPYTPTEEERGQWMQELRRSRFNRDGRRR